MKCEDFGPGKIIHVDMDSFYASAEMLRRPHLIGQPVAVGGSPKGRGVIATASYEARKFGVKSATPASRALKLCPDLVFIRPDFGYYKKLSTQIRNIFKDYSEYIQPLSLDEAYLDVTGRSEFDGSATLIAKDIKRRILEEVGLVASAGVAPNKFLAKVASDWNKPDGLFTIGPHQVQSFVYQLDVGKIPGVGKKSVKRLNAKGLFKCGDIQKWPLSDLVAKFGRWGEYLHQVSRGIDMRRVKSGGARKSLSLERTFSKDMDSVEQILSRVPELIDQLENRLARAKITHPIATEFVKVKFHDFKQTTMEQKYAGTIKKERFEELFRQTFERRAEPVRLMGLGVRFLVPEKKRSKPGQLDLF